MNPEIAPLLKRISRSGSLLILACWGCFPQGSFPEHFEVASVKHSEQKGMGRFRGDPEHVTYESTTLQLLIRDAYHLEPYQLSGPSWLNTELYTVTAKEPPGTTLEQFRHMLANLLAERFGLVTHRVMKDFAGYEIVVAKGGPKLAAAAPTADKFPAFDGSRDANGLMGYTFRQTSMKLLTNRLEIMMRMTSPVVDHTGIDGKFDFHLDVETPPQSPADPGDNVDNISDAMQNQLGLKLNRVKIPLEVLVVDHAERQPAAN
jgi:uncharacterized protein (TIGR03435 family)